MNHFQQCGVDHQLNSMTKEEAIKNFEWSCSYCRYVTYCVPTICPIARAHQNRLAYLETGLQNQPLTRCFPAEDNKVKSKPKKEIPWQTKALKAVIRYLDKCYELAKKQKHPKSRKLACLLDDITVQLTVDNSTVALDWLQKDYALIYFEAAKRYEKYNPNGYKYIKKRG
jgi:hypothetical protein